MLTSMSKHNHESGFGVVELVLIVVIIAVLGVISWMVYKNAKIFSYDLNSAR
jgi:Tfp pilus assembly protein PilE